MKSTVDEILKAAGAEHEARAPAEIVEFPLVSRHLKATQAPPIREGAIGVWTPVAWLVGVGPYLSVSLVAVSLLLVGMDQHRKSILAGIGEFACSADGQQLLLEEDPSSHVPRIREELLVQCARAHRRL